MPVLSTTLISSISLFTTFVLMKNSIPMPTAKKSGKKIRIATCETRITSLHFSARHPVEVLGNDQDVLAGLSECGDLPVEFAKSAYEPMGVGQKKHLFEKFSRLDRPVEERGLHK